MESESLPPYVICRKMVLASTALLDSCTLEAFKEGLPAGAHKAEEETAIALKSVKIVLKRFISSSFTNTEAALIYPFIYLVAVSIPLAGRKQH
jgi:hypothetical protein